MKKIFLLILIASLGITAASCGKKEVQPGLSDATSQTETQSDTQNEKLKEEREKIQNATSEHDPDTKTRNVVLYFPDKNMQYLKAEERAFNSDDAALHWALVSELIKGPKDNTLTPSIQGDVQVISLDVKDGLCTLDLSGEFATTNTGGSAKETMALYSIVNTLCQSKDIDRVKINIEGNTEAEFGEFLLDEPLVAKDELISE